MSSLHELVSPQLNPRAATSWEGVSACSGKQQIRQLGLITTGKGRCWRYSRFAAAVFPPRGDPFQISPTKQYIFAWTDNFDDKSWVVPSQMDPVSIFTTLFHNLRSCRLSDFFLVPAPTVTFNWDFGGFRDFERFRTHIQWRNHAYHARNIRSRGAVSRATECASKILVDVCGTR